MDKETARRRRVGRRTPLTSLAVLVIAGCAGCSGEDTVAREPPTTVPPATAPPTTAPTTVPTVPAIEDPAAEGWTDIDAGPLSPRQGASLTWTGTEVIVLGGERQHDGAAYDPDSGTWRTLPEPPLPDGVPQVVWTGEELLAVVDSDPMVPGTRRRTAAAYSPATDTWRAIATPPDVSAPNLGDVMDPALLWTGREAVLADAWSAYEPTTDRWRALPDTDAEGNQPLAGGRRAGAVDATGRLWFAAAGVETVVFDVAAGVWEALPPAPDAGVVDTWGAAVVVGGALYLAAEGLAVQRFADTRWQALDTPAVGGTCLPEAVVVDDQPLVDLCSEIIWQAPDGSWVETTVPTGCCYPNIVAAGTDLFVWESNDDTINDRSAPHKSFRRWSPTALAD